MKNLLLSIALAAGILSGTAQSSSQKIDQLMQAYHDIGQYNGVVLVADSGKIIYHKALGYGNLADSVPLSIDQKFRISSMTKQFTAMLIMQLVEKDKLHLTDKISDHLPYYRKETGQQVSIHHLLSHQSGIPNISSYRGFRTDSIKIPLPLEFLITNWCMGDLQFTSGIASQYSNSNYMILGAIIEHITGLPYGTVLQQKILDPIGMSNTGLVPDSIYVENMLIGYVLTDSSFVEEEPIAYSNLHAAGQMYSTTYDMFLWDRALATNKLLSKELQDNIFTDHRDGHGYGWKVYRRLYEGQTDSCTTSYHAGGFEGFSSFIQRFHERDMVMIFMANTNQERKRTGTISDDIIYILFGLPYELPLQKTAIEISEEDFKKYAGVYITDTGKERSIQFKDQRFIYKSGRREYRLYPESKNTFFFSTDNRSTVSFAAKDNAMIMTVHTSQKDIVYKKK